MISFSSDFTNDPRELKAELLSAVISGELMKETFIRGSLQSTNKQLVVTHLEKRSAMALLFPRPPTNDSSLAVTRKDCVAQDFRLNEAFSISANNLRTWNTKAQNKKQNYMY